MVEAKTPAIQIGQLNLRVPGNNPEAGHRLANSVAESLARQIPPGLQGKFGALNVRVRLPLGASEAEMSGAIAQSILNVLSKGNFNRGGI